MKHTLFALVALLTAPFWVGAQATATNPYQLLWEIKSPGAAQASYLFGTMHVTDERVFQLPDSVLLAIQNSPGFALEVDFDSASYRFFEYMNATHGPDLFNEDTWQHSIQTQKSWDGEGGRDFDPGELFKLFNRDEEHEQEATFLDAFLYRLAHDQGKITCGLEEIVDQLQLLTEDEVPMTEPTSEGQENKPRKRLRLTNMIDLYAKGDLKAIDELVNQGNSSAYFKNEVIIKRNYGMAERADSLIRLRPTFIGVGAAHLPGQEGVIELLHQRGYQVRPVLATYTGMAEQARKKVYIPRWTTFQKLGEGYRLKVPAKPFGIDILDGSLKMYMGMDFPSGMVYCFYAFNLPDEIDSAKIEELGETVISSFSANNGSPARDSTLTYRGLKGREICVEKDGEFLRIRLLFGEQKLYMLLLGNSEKVTASPAADEWFNSLEFFPPVAMLDQPRQQVVDEAGGFSISLPDDYDLERHQVGGFPTGGYAPIYNKYELEDDPHAQLLRLICEDYVDPWTTGELEPRMPDCIRFMMGEELEPVGELEAFTRDGVEGMRGTYETEKYRYKINCYVRYNRLYVLGIGTALDDPDSLAVDSIFDSMRFLPLKPYALTVRHRVDSLFEALLPGTPTTWEQLRLPYQYDGMFDTLQVYYYHDPATSLNAKIEHAKVWEYYAGNNKELYRAIADEIDPDAEPIMDFPQSDLPQSDFVGRCKILRLDTAKGLRLATYCIPSGENVLIGHLQLPQTAETDAQLLQFEQAFQSLAPKAPQAFREHRLNKFLAEIASEDSTVADEAAYHLGSYRLQPAEYDSAARAFERLRDDDPFGNDQLLLEALTRPDDSALYPILQQLYADLPSNAPQRMEILSSVMRQDWLGANQWAIAQVKANPTDLDNTFFYFSWTSYLVDDSTGARLKDLAFLLDHPTHALALAASAGVAAGGEDDRYSAYHAQFLQILTAAVDHRQRSDYDYRQDLYIDQLLYYVAEQGITGWKPIAHRMIAFNDGFLPCNAFALLGDHGDMPSGKEIKHVLSIRESRDYALTWMLSNGKGYLLPGKYRKPDYIAAVALDIALEDYPDKVELIEKRKIYYDQQYQWLYVYRFAFEDDRDWTLGFAGPVPLDGLPSEAYLPLSGSNYDTYSPTTYKKKVKAWITEYSEE